MSAEREDVATAFLAHGLAAAVVDGVAVRPTQTRDEVVANIRLGLGIVDGHSPCREPVGLRHLRELPQLVANIVPRLAVDHDRLAVDLARVFAPVAITSSCV